MIQPLFWNGDALWLLDQRRLPVEVTYLECREWQAVAMAIRELAIRGAPAIGIAAAYGMALGAYGAATQDVQTFGGQLREVAAGLLATRPTAINLAWALDRMTRTCTRLEGHAVETIKGRLLEEAHAIAREDVEQNLAIGRAGAALLPAGAHVLTYCNTGGLATGGHGTALGVVRSAWEAGTLRHVLVCETRPVLQGSRLTVWELLQDKIPTTLITDNMAGALMRQGEVAACVVGADRIAANGDVANKIGTYSLAVLARAHNLPFYVAAPTSTIDFSINSGDQIPIEQRRPEEVTTLNGTRIAPEDTTVLNPAFDITPARYITAIITERGAGPPGDLRRLQG